MYVIKMNDDKSLITTIKASIYQGENNADTLVFIVPQTYEETDLINCTMYLRYIFPNGEGKSEELEMRPEIYKNYYQYGLKISSRLTSIPGNIELWLTALDINNNTTLKSESIFITVEPTKSITDYFTEEDRDQLDIMSEKIALLEQNKADNIIYDKNNNSIQLTSNGNIIGSPINYSSCGIKSFDITEDDEIIITLMDDREINLGHIEGASGVTFIPHISKDNILTWTNDGGLENPDPVDLNPFDEWIQIEEGAGTPSEYIWEFL